MKLKKVEYNLPFLLTYEEVEKEEEEVAHCCPACFAGWTRRRAGTLNAAGWSRLQRRPAAEFLLGSGLNDLEFVGFKMSASFNNYG